MFGGVFVAAFEAADANLEGSVHEYDAADLPDSEVVIAYVDIRTFEQRLKNPPNVQIQEGSLELSRLASVRVNPTTSA